MMSCTEPIKLAAALTCLHPHPSAKQANKSRGPFHASWAMFEASLSTQALQQFIEIKIALTALKAIDRPLHQANELKSMTSVHKSASKRAVNLSSLNTAWESGRTSHVDSRADPCQPDDLPPSIGCYRS
ncbi:hypothetical protein ACOMHN_047550 [Nucella lapillus]